MDRDEILALVRATTLIETTNVSDATIVSLINQGVQEVGAVTDWPFLEASTTITLVADDRDYALPNDYDRFYMLVDDDNDRSLEYVAPSRFLHMVGNDTGNTGATPDFWSIIEDQIWLSPIPSSADTDRLSFYYYKTVTELATGAAVPEWHAAFHYVLVEYCKWKLWEREEYFDQSERSFITYSRYLDGMQSWYGNKGRQFPVLWGDGTRKVRNLNLPANVV